MKKNTFLKTFIIIASVIVIFFAGVGITLFTPVGDTVTSLIFPKDPVDLTGTWRTETDEAAEMSLDIKGTQVTVNAEINFGLESDEEIMSVFGDSANETGFHIGDGTLDIEKQEFTFTDLSDYLQETYSVTDKELESWLTEPVPYELSEDETELTMEIGGETLVFKKQATTASTDAETTSSTISSSSSASSSSEE